MMYYTYQPTIHNRIATFVSGIHFLIKNGITNVPVDAETSQTISGEIPTWIKSNANFWAQGLISDSDFLSGIEYLVKRNNQNVIS